MNVAAPVVSFFNSFLKKIIPNRILEERGVIIRLGSGAGPIYTRMRVLDTIGMNPINQRLVPASASSFVFVCFGNIMRSPMADALLKQAATETGAAIHSDSAGLHAIPGKAAHPWAQAAANELGISLADHHAKLLTAEMLEKADAIFAMDFQNLSELLSLYPRYKDKMFMLGAYASNPRIHEISDPYLGDLETTRQCYRLLQACVRNLLASRTVSPQ